MKALRLSTHNPLRDQIRTLDLVHGGQATGVILRPEFEAA